MLAFANAKINIGLQVTEKLSDGYHNIQTVFYPIKINDVVEITDSDTLSCKVVGIDIDGNPEDNICYKAFKLIQEDYGIPNQQIILLKNIPVGAGLGGGSSDAAHLIKLLNTKFALGLTNMQMEHYASRLGADCAFFIENKPVYAYGKGDQFKPLQLDLSNHYMVLVKPPIHVSTSEAYAGMIPKSAEVYLPQLLSEPINTWKDKIKNDFEQMVFKKHPEIQSVKNTLYEHGARYAAMSGSGSSVFGIFDQAVDLNLLADNNKVYYNI